MQSDNDSSDLDGQIDDILQVFEAEDANATNKGSSGRKTSQDKSIMKTTSSSSTVTSAQTKNIPGVFGGSNSNTKPEDSSGKAASGKLVRFQDTGNEEVDNTISAFKKPSSSNLLNTMFFPDEEITPLKKNFQKGGNSTGSGSGSDWLGLKPSSEISSATESQKKQQNSLDVFMDYNFDLPLSSEGIEETKPTNKAKPSPTVSNEVRKPLVPPSNKLETPQSPRKTLNSKTPFSLDSLAEIRTENSSFVPKTVPTVIPPKASQEMSSTSVQQPQKSGAMSLAEALPFLLSNRQKSQSPTADGSGDVNRNENESPQPPKTSGKVVKKKVAAKSASNVVIGSGSGTATLQLPSHLVNEDELKAMSSSLKTLYANQLELQEQSYKEQLDFFAAASKRKEDFLQEELTRLQEDYELRMQKLKAEHSEKDVQLPQMLNQVSQITSNLNQLSSQLQSLSDLKNVPNSVIESKEFRGTEEVTQVIQQSLRTIFEELESNLSEKISSAVTNVEKTKYYDGLEKIDSKLNDLSDISRSSIDKILNGQMQFKDTLLKSISEAIISTLNQDRDRNLGKRDKTSIQMKELRKDLRRLYIALDGKNDQIHRSQLSLEMEQRTITQSVRDINTVMKVYNESKPQGHTNNDSTFSQIANMQANVQNEMEIKLLRDERRSLSECVAQMNVDRRKLADEKLSLEREKMDFERDKHRVQDIEVRSKARMAEAEDLKRQAEVIRQKELGMITETESKLKDISKEKSKLKERLHELEQAFALREQKLYEEKCEIIRDKEFVDKLRDQLLCPGCLKVMRTEALSTYLMPPPPYQRPSGDGLDLGSYKISHILTPQENAYFLHEKKYLEDLEERANAK